MYRKNYLSPGLILIVFICSFLCNEILLTEKCYAEQYKLIPGVIHVHSTISNGEKTPEEIVQLAKEKGMKAVIFTDHDTMRWSYGTPPLKGVLHKVVEQNSILKYGAANYINTIEGLNEKYPDMLIMHGAEAIPFYYWQGSFLKDTLVLQGGNKHILAMGLQTPSSYENLPSVGNGYPSIFTIESFFSLWPLSLFLLGWLLISLRKNTNSTENEDSNKTKYNKTAGIVCFFIGVVFLVNNFPFKTPLFDQYHDDQYVFPYQYLIDYVDEQDGVTFWAHPEVDRSMEISGIKVVSSPYEEYLLNTFNYTGIAIFSEGMRRVGPPGGIWDQILLQYCTGIRERPVWVIGEVDYKVQDFPIDETQTMFLLKEKSNEAILNALRTGKMYAAMGAANSLTLNSFVVEDVDSGKLAFMGDEITMKDKPRIRIVVTVDDLDKSSPPERRSRAGEYGKRNFNIDLIRSGSVIKTFEADGSIDIAYDDDYHNPGEKVYYRLAIDTGYLYRGIVTNPVFVQFAENNEPH